MFIFLFEKVFNSLFASMILFKKTSSNQVTFTLDVTNSDVELRLNKCVGESDVRDASVFCSVFRTENGEAFCRKDEYVHDRILQIHTT